MRIIDQSKASRLACVKETSGGRKLPCPVAVEHGIDVFINERPAMRLTCTPEHLDELVVGRLFTEGMIRGLADILGVHICEQGLRAKVMLTSEAAERLENAKTAEVSTCCTDNRTLLASSDTELPAVRPVAWEPAWLRLAADGLRGHQPLYGQTHAVHAACLMRRDRLLCCREDIGRHNALDKVIGWALLAGEAPEECLLYCTGRLPVDMLRKAIRAGVPVLASKTYPTDQALLLAAQTGLTMVTLRPDGGQVVWNGRE